MNKETNLTSDNSSFLRSVSNETKEHFDSLLKKALHKNDKLKKDVNYVNSNIKKLDKTKYTEKETKSKTENPSTEKETKSKTENPSPDTGNFILDKFLIDAVNSKKELNEPEPSEKKAPESNHKVLNSVTFIKAPVPLPRSAIRKDRSLTSPLSRQGTYSISSPILRNVDLLKDIEKLSTCSRTTYDITDPKVFAIQEDDNQSDTSRGTYNIYKPDEKKLNTRANTSEVAEILFNETVDSVGDVIIHNSPTSKGLLKIVDKNKRQSGNISSRASTRGSKIHYESDNSIQRKEMLGKGKNSVENEQIEKYNIKESKDTTGSKASARSSKINYESKEKPEMNKNEKVQKQSNIKKPTNFNTGSKSSARSSKLHYETNKSIQRKEKPEKDKNSSENEQIDKHSNIRKPKDYNTGSTASARTSKIHYESEKSKDWNEKSEKDSNDPKAIELVDLMSETTSRSKKEKKKLMENISIDGTETSFKEPLFTYKDLIGVIVYKTDKLLLYSAINHPCVKIHIVDSETGEYLTRSRETDGADVNQKHVYPLITKSYKLQQNRSLIPYWEELMVFTEDFNYMLEYKESVIIFFEILDFLSFSAASMKYDKEGSNSGWHKIAWAFLKLVSKTGELNTEQKIRLQLYKPKKFSTIKNPTQCVLYDWWCKGSLSKYPSTLHVSIKRVKADSLKETKHSDAVFKSELGLNIVEKDKDTRDEDQDQDTASIAKTPQINWSRMPNQPCKIPNKVQAKLKTATKGCFALKFSNNGLLLACGVADEEKYAILIYSVLNKQQEYCKLAGHQGIIYHLCWSSDDKYLISSSADCTVYIWDVSKRHFYPKQVLPHPAFVYCAQTNEDLLQIITGCYDQVVRIWISSAVESNYELLQELDGHTGYITSLCFVESKNIFYSADSVGIIIEWNYNKEWSLKRTLKFKDFDKTVINNIMLHPGANRMLVFCRDSTHRMIDLSVGCIVQWYRGALNYRVHTNGYLSPCGSLVFAPSEDGSIFVWNTDTGKFLTAYNPYNKISNEIIVPHCIHYHPLDNIVAISHYGSAVPIFFCIFDNLIAEKELQLKNCTEVKEQEKKSKKEPETKMQKPTVRKHAKGNNNLSFDVIIDKIDDVLVTAKTD